MIRESIIVFYCWLSQVLFILGVALNHKRKIWEISWTLHLTNFVDTGPTICCYQDGVYSKIILLRSLNKWIRSSSSPLDWVRASLHTVLAPSTYMGFGVLVARVCCRCLAPEVLSWHQKERTTERLQEERVGRLKIYSSNLRSRITFLLSVSATLLKFGTQAC